MNRRAFLGLVGAAAYGQSPPRVALSFDDFAWSDIPRLTPDEAMEAYLRPLAKRDLKVTLFVCGRHVRGERGIELLKSWGDAGHLIGNHTFSHRSYHDSQITPAAFFDDIDRGQAAIESVPGFRKIFRFPQLKEGNTEAKRDACRAFLRKHGYRTGHVSIDASDWFYDQHLRARLAADGAVDLTRYREAYLAHLWDRAVYYDALARKVLGRSIPHVLLLHYNYSNALLLDSIAEMFGSRGWRLIGTEEAFADPVYRKEPDIVPAGESLIWALAKESGRFAGELRYPGEDGEYEKDKVEALGL
jgi:peptidoglycan/xylan/chitin deacetylase (PgdA/CDA1 family)